MEEIIKQMNELASKNSGYLSIDDLASLLIIAYKQGIKDASKNLMKLYDNSRGRL